MAETPGNDGSADRGANAAHISGYDYGAPAAAHSPQRPARDCTLDPTLHASGLVVSQRPAS